MEPLSLLSTRKKSTATKLTKSSRLFKTIIKAIQEKKGENIVSLDLRKIHEAVADFFIICEASNPQQVRAIGEFVEEEVKKHCEEAPYKHEGYQALQWVLIDYVNIVVHVMMPEPRNFTSLKKCGAMHEREEHQG